MILSNGLPLNRLNRLLVGVFVLLCLCFIGVNFCIFSIHLIIIILMFINIWDIKVVAIPQSEPAN